MPGSASRPASRGRPPPSPKKHPAQAAASRHSQRTLPSYPAFVDLATTGTRPPTLAGFRDAAHRMAYTGAIQVDERLLGAIGTPSIQSLASETLRRAMAALDGFGRLDEGLFERFVAMRDAEGGLSEDNLRSLWEETFRGLLELL